MARMFYNDVSGVFLCFDLTDADSFDAISYWLTDLAQHAPKDAIKCLCGLKLDLIQPAGDGGHSSIEIKRAVRAERAHALANTH